jgi:hypothetical protein
MPDAKVERRKLDFHNFDEVVADAERLLQTGYDKAGNWDLSQVCYHLTEWLRFTMDGFPPVPWFVHMVRWTIGGTIKRKVLRSRSMPAGGPTLKVTISPPGDPAAAVERLRQTVERFKQYTGELHPSRMFGRMNRDEWENLNLIHCAHHLSFLIPRSR